MKKFRLGLPLKFGISLSLIVILISILLSFFLAGIERLRAENEVTNKGTALTRNLALNCEYGILAGNVDNLEKLARSLMEDSDVIYVQISDEKGKLLAKVEKKERMSGGVFNVEAPVKSLRLERTPEEIGVSPMAAAGTAQKENLIGQVKVGFSLARVQTIVNDLLYIIFNLTFFVTLAGILSIILLTWILLVSPLQQFIAGIRRVAEGDLTRRIQIKTRDEFGELAATFNTMSDELERAREKLSKHAEELEKKVAERTQELEAAKTSLEKKVAERTQELKNEQASLEEKVKARTSELQEKLNELQVFYDTTVSRELKMVELEKEIEKLKRQPKNEGAGEA